MFWNKDFERSAAKKKQKEFKTDWSVVNSALEKAAKRIGRYSKKANKNGTYCLNNIFETGYTIREEWNTIRADFNAYKHPHKDYGPTVHNALEKLDWSEVMKMPGYLKLHRACQALNVHIGRDCEDTIILNFKRPYADSPDKPSALTQQDTPQKGRTP